MYAMSSGASMINMQYVQCPYALYYVCDVCMYVCMFAMHDVHTFHPHMHCTHACVQYIHYPQHITPHMWNACTHASMHACKPRTYPHATPTCTHHTAPHRVTLHHVASVHCTYCMYTSTRDTTFRYVHTQLASNACITHTSFAYIARMKRNHAWHALSTNMRWIHTLVHAYLLGMHASDASHHVTSIHATK